MQHAATRTSRAVLGPDVGIIVHSHLRWDFVWQRPQQLLSRLAETNRILFVEEPIVLDDIDAATLELSSPLPNLTRAIPRLPREVAVTYDDAIAAVRLLVADALGTEALASNFARNIQWFYTPMAAPEMLGAFGESAVVYDCMDELAQFRFAPADIGRRERMLLSRADVVFTGGHRLYESKSRFHDNVHFFGCGVDLQHFGQARSEGTEVPADAAALPGPVMGYFGVIDERLDYDLLGRLADSQPDATLLMIGPVVKVDPQDLPQSKNIRWLGQRDYTQLPAYVKAFDVCLMPFALNEATEFINPTKTLEYMAAGKPIVSTAVRDVVRNFVPVVRVATDAEDFATQVAEALTGRDERRIQQGLQLASESSWDSIVWQMGRLIGEALAVETRAGDLLLADIIPTDSDGRNLVGLKSPGDSGSGAAADTQ